MGSNGKGYVLLNINKKGVQVASGYSTLISLTTRQTMCLYLINNEWINTLAAPQLVENKKKNKTAISLTFYGLLFPKLCI